MSQSPNYLFTIANNRQSDFRETANIFLEERFGWSGFFRIGWTNIVRRGAKKLSRVTRMTRMQLIEPC